MNQLKISRNLMISSGLTRINLSGPAVNVGVTMYVLSISALSEVEMVLKRRVEIVVKMLEWVV